MDLPRKQVEQEKQKKNKESGNNREDLNRIQNIGNTERKVRGNIEYREKIQRKNRDNL